MFGERLKACRTDAGLTLKNLGEKLNLAESTISLYESGKRAPDHNTLRKIADILEVSSDYLIGRTNEKSPTQNERDITMNDFQYALYDQSRELTEDDKERLLGFAKMLRNMKKDKGGQAKE